MQYETLGHMPLLVALAGRRRRDDVRCVDDGRRPVRDLRRRLRRDRRAPHPWPVARAVAHGRDDLGPRLGDRRGLGELGAGHRRHAQVRPGAGRATTSRCRCGRTGGRPCRCTASRTCSAPPDKRAALDFMPGSDVPVIRQPFEPGDALPFWAGTTCVDQHHCYDVGNDPDEDEDLVGTARRARDARAAARRAARRRCARRAAGAPRSDLVSPSWIARPGATAATRRPSRPRG